MLTRELIELWRESGATGVIAAFKGPVLIPVVPPHAGQLERSRRQTSVEITNVSHDIRKLVAGMIGAKDPASNGIRSRRGEEQPALELQIAELCKVVGIPKAPISVGRSSHSDIPLYDSSISRAHAELLAADGDWHVQDSRSRNGTKLNGWLLPSGQKRALHAGDLVTFGDLEFIYCPRTEEAVETVLGPIKRR